MSQIRYVDSKNQLADFLTKGHCTRDDWNHLLQYQPFQPSKLRFVQFSKLHQTMAKRHQEGDYDERVVAKSKPVRNLVSRSCAVPSTMPSSTVSSSPVKVRSEDHEMRFETRTAKPGSANQRESLIERDRVTNSQEMNEDSRSRATTLSPMTREPSQTTENPTICRGRPVPTIKKLGCWQWLGDERRMQYSFCPLNLIQKKSEWEVANCTVLSSRQRDERKWQEFSYLVNIDDFIHACSDPSWEELFREFARHTKLRSKTNCTETVRCDSNTDPRTRFGDLGSVRVKLDWLEIGEVAPGTRQGGHPAHEGKSLCILRLSIVCGKNSSIPAIKLRMVNQIDAVLKCTAIQRIEWTRWGTSTVRDPPRNPKVDGRTEL